MSYKFLNVALTAGIVSTSILFGGAASAFVLSNQNERCTGTIFHTTEYDRTIGKHVRIAYARCADGGYQEISRSPMQR